MNVSRHAGLTFSGSKPVLAVPYRLDKAVEHPERDCEVFLHIPKCGGTTLHFIIACCAEFTGKQYTRYVIRDINPPVFIRNGWTGAWGEVLRSMQNPGGVPAYISGHFPFGIHSHINGSCQYITLLRDPVAREISSFNHHYQKGFLDGDASLLCQMVDRKAVLDNPQVRMLAGVGSMTGKCSEEIFQNALDNLGSHFSLVGVVEKSNEFLRALIALNGWPAIAYVRTQVSSVKAIKTASNELTEMLYEYHSFDRKLHELMTKKWEEWKNNCIQGEGHLNPTDPVICLPSGIHETKKPLLMRAEQLGMKN